MGEFLLGPAIHCIRKIFLFKATMLYDQCSEGQSNFLPIFCLFGPQSNHAHTSAGCQTDQSHKEIWFKVKLSLPCEYKAAVLLCHKQELHICSVWLMLQPHPLDHGLNYIVIDSAGSQQLLMNTTLTLPSVWTAFPLSQQSDLNSLAACSASKTFAHVFQCISSGSRNRIDEWFQ